MPKVDEDAGKSRDGSKTDDEAVEREEEAIKLDGLNVAQMKEIRDKAEKFAFQAEVSRMMKLIINSLYRNKEVRPIAIIQLCCIKRGGGAVSYKITLLLICWPCPPGESYILIQNPLAKMLLLFLV